MSISKSFNYDLPNPEDYDLNKKRNKFVSSSMDLKRSNFKNTLLPQKKYNQSIDSKRHPKSNLIKENIIKIKGYNHYSQYSQNKSFFGNKTTSDKFTKYLINDVLKPTYQQDFDRVKSRQATKLIEKKYQYSNEPRKQNHYFTSIILSIFFIRNRKSNQ